MGFKYIEFFLGVKLKYTFGQTDQRETQSSKKSLEKEV